MSSIQGFGQWAKKHPIAAFFSFIFMALVLALVALYLYDTKPWKVKNPSNPRFDVSKFDPNDYLNHTELAEVLRKLLKPNVSTIADVNMLWCKKTPCGQNIETIPNFKNSRLDLCLSKVGNKADNEKIYWYTETGKGLLFGGWNLWAFYNNEDKLTKLCADDVSVF